MDLHKLYQAVNDELFIDITLTLIDRNNEITMDLHKIILYSSCIYFEKLLTSCKEKHLNEITIEVPNAFVCYDIIMSFYGQKTNIGNLPGWQHLLESVRCSDFLGLKSDILLENLEIPNNGFGLLLDVVDIIGYDFDNTNIVVKNLPKDYDLSKLNKDLIKKILEFYCNKIVSGSKDGSIKIWNEQTGELINTLNGHSNFVVYSVRFSSDNKRIVSGSTDNSIKIWNAATGKLINTLISHNNSVGIVCFSSDNKRIVSGSCDNSIKIWNADTGELINTLNGHIGAVYSVCFSSDNKRIISGSYNNNIKIWNADTGELINTLYGHSGTVYSVCFSPDLVAEAQVFNNKRIISGSGDRSIKIWNAENGELINTLNGHNGDVLSVCFSSDLVVKSQVLDNKRIVSGSSDNSIKIWNAENGELMNTLNGHTAAVNSVCFSSDNKRIVSGSDDGSIKIWDADIGELINTLNGHIWRVNSVCCSPNYNTDLMEKLKKIIN